MLHRRMWSNVFKLAGRRYGVKCMSTGNDNILLRHLIARIKANGPMTVAEYMKEVLINPVAGYYMKKDVFGEKGDFITSPEISQMFGELIGIWVINEWQNAGSPPKIQVVELGPGRGTLASDMMRVFSQFKEFNKAVSMHLVEISPAMTALQEKKLAGSGTSDKKDITYKKHTSPLGTEIHWYKYIEEVPRDFSCFIAHEFFDAIPIHKFQKQNDKWHEVMVDADNEDKLKFVSSHGPNIHTSLYMKHVDQSDERDHIEVSPQSGVLVQEIATRIKEHGGFGLLADYGHDGTKTDTFRGFHKHKVHSVLDSPGEVDLTADVDFSYLRYCCRDLVSTHGPITQQSFLNNMGIGVRLQALLQNADEKTAKQLKTGCWMLMHPNEMGERFKFFSVHPLSKKDYQPAGFVSIFDKLLK